MPQSIPISPSSQAIAETMLDIRRAMDELVAIQGRAKAETETTNRFIESCVETLHQTIDGSDEDTRRAVASALYWNDLPATFAATILGVRIGRVYEFINPIEVDIICSKCGVPAVTLAHSKQDRLELRRKKGYRLCPTCQAHLDALHARGMNELDEKRAQQWALIQHLRSLPYPEYLKSDHWQDVRRRALQRSKYRCQLCGIEGQILDVHHSTYENRGCEYNRDVIVLCRPCHAKHHDKAVQ